MTCSHLRWETDGCQNEIFYLKPVVIAEEGRRPPFVYGCVSVIQVGFFREKKSEYETQGVSS